MNINEHVVVDRIYEAALVPELWQAVIDDLCTVSGSTSGAVLLISPRYGARAIASESVDAAFQQSIANPAWEESARIARLVATPSAGFLRSHDLLSADEIERDAPQHVLRSVGIEAQSASHVRFPSGESARFIVDRQIGLGLHTAANIENLNRFQPHLARAATMATRLGLERAQAMVGTLQAIGLPAAALTADGRALAVNPAFEQMRVLRPAAFGKISIASDAAEAMFQQSLREAASAAIIPVRSIPVPAGEDPVASPPLVLHLMPVRGAAHDVFAQTAMVLIATPFGATAAMPDLSLLHGLFDLTPKEAALAAALASGKSLHEAAALNGIQYSTARTHLEHIFQKTGVKQQTQLVLLLQGAHSLWPTR